MTKRIILISGFIIIFFQAVAQQDSIFLDTALVLKNIKIRLFPELDLAFLSKTELEDYLNRGINATFLKSKGFENIVFFKISNQLLVSDTIKDLKEIHKISLPPCLLNGQECYFVFAFNKRDKTFYRLKGTKSLDFVDFYNSLVNWPFWKPIPKMNNQVIKSFTEYFWVEGLDFQCLLKSLKGGKGNCLDFYSPKLEVW